MSYTATIKHIPAQTIYCKEYTMGTFEDYFREMPALGDKLRAKYPNLKCATPAYCYVVNLDREWRETNNHIMFCEAVDSLEEDFDGIRSQMRLHRPIERNSCARLPLGDKMLRIENQ